jgi:hypothetical protein
MIRIVIEIPTENADLAIKIAELLAKAGSQVEVSKPQQAATTPTANSGNGQYGTLLAYTPQRPGKKGEVAVVQMDDGTVKNVAVFDRVANPGQKVVVYRKPSGYSGLRLPTDGEVPF